MVAILLALAVLGPAQTDRVEALTFAPPRTVVALDKIKGEPIQLAWSPDGQQLYVESGSRTRIGTFESLHHYLLTVADGKVQSVDAAPQWATDYLTWKSGQRAPAMKTLAIEISESRRTERAVSAPMGGALAKGGESGASTGNMDEAVSASLASQTQHVITLKLKGETVGEYVDTQFVPGYTFSWAPQSFGTLIAYINVNGRLGVMDAQGGKKEVAGTERVLLPAWADSGQQIAFVQKDNKKYGVYVTALK